MPKPILDPEGEKALIERVRSGDTEAFTGLVERYQGPLIGFLSNMIRDEEAARDLAQETFVKAYTSIGSFETRNQAAFSTWLFAIARNACLDAMRSRKRRSGQIGSNHPELRVDTAQPGYPEAWHFRNALENALAKMGVKYRMAFELTLVQGFSFGETAIILKTNTETIRARVKRTRESLRKTLRHFRGRSEHASG